MSSNCSPVYSLNTRYSSSQQVSITVALSVYELQCYQTLSSLCTCTVHVHVYLDTCSVVHVDGLAIDLHYSAGYLFKGFKFKFFSLSILVLLCRVSG